MNTDELLDDALGQLEPAQLAALDLAASQDQGLAMQRTNLRLSLERLLDDGEEDLEPPPGLLEGALDRVAALKSNNRRRVLEYAPSPSRLRWSDFAVAASILVAGLLTLVPALQRSRMQMAQVGCLGNLQQIGQALNSYWSVNRSYPYVHPSHPGSYVGSYAVLLNDGGYLPTTSVLDCPCGGRDDAPTLPGFQTLCEHERRIPGGGKGSFPLDYAYSLGRIDSHGGLGPPTPSNDGMVAMVADRPPFVFDGLIERVLDGNSPVHAGLGQNVLFTGGNARWQHNRHMGPLDDDLYLNQHDRLAPGVNDRDAVLTPAVFHFRHN
jgi:hypothetical protein